MNSPICKKIPKTLTAHNHQRIDNYYWLNERENPEVISYLEKENEYCEEMMGDTKDLQAQIYEEIVARLDKNEASVPYLLDGYYYYTRYQEGGEYPLYCRKKGSLENEEEILINQNELALGKSFCSLGKLGVCPNNQYLAFSADYVSRRLYSIFFKNLKSGEILSVEIPNTSGGFAWSGDGKYLFYVLKDTVTLRSYKVFRHEFGTPVEQDVEVYCEEDDTFILSVYKSKSKEYIWIGAYQSISTEFRYIKASEPLSEFKVLQTREKNHEYSVEHYGEHFYIVSNWKAKNFRLLKTSVSNTDKSFWVELIPHRQDVLLSSVELFSEFMVLDERKNGLTQFRIIEHQSKAEHYIDLQEETYTAYLSTNVDFNTAIFRFGFTSLVTPSTIYDYHFATRERVIKKQQQVVGGYDSSQYQSKRIWATAKDGVKVPISLVYKKELFQEGKNSMLLYAYGSYGHVVDPGFSPARLSLLDRGFVFAIAHIRGGEDLGRHWYDDGKMLNKINTFTDFIACGEHLIQEKYVEPQHLMAMGGSAGGLLMGAVINMAPKLWKAVIAAVPFVDVVTTMLDDTIPLTTGEYDEWGNPNEREYYDYILSYSPYDNIEAKEYPALLVTTGLHDSQVQYWEPAKWVAKLRELKTDKHLLLLKTDMEVGHGGASGRYEYYKETAFEYAFLLKHQ